MCISKHQVTVKRCHSVRAKVGLERPVVPGALSDGLLPVSLIGNPVNKPLKFEFNIWDGAKPEDSYRARWDGEFVGTPTPVGTNAPGTTVELEIPISLLTHKKHTLQYNAMSFENNTDDDSDITPIEVDIEIPGGTLHGPISFPRTIEGGLTSAELTALNDVLVGTVTTYIGMAEKDSIQSYWGTVAGPTSEVTTVDGVLVEAKLNFTRAFLEAQDQGPQDVTYTILDRAGNLSNRSVGTPIELLLSSIPSNFPPVIVEDAKDGLITYAEAQAGVAVEIPKYAGAMAGDRIRLFWGSNNDVGEFPILPGDESEPVVLVFNLPLPTLSAFPEATVQVSYEVYRSGRLIGSSTPEPVVVFLTLPVSVQLDPLVIQGTSTNPDKTDNYIDPDDFELDARALFTWKTGLITGDFINLYWGEEVMLKWKEISLSEANAGVNLTLLVPNKLMMDAGTGLAIPVRYTVTRTGNPNPARDSGQEVTVRSALEQPGGADGPQQPEFPRTTPGGVIGPIENPNGTLVHVPRYLNIKEDHTIFLTFTGYDNDDVQIPAATFSAQRKFDELDIVNGYTFNIPADRLKAICIGYARAVYRVEPLPSHNQVGATSATARIRVNMSRPSQPNC